MLADSSARVPPLSGTECFTQSFVLGMESQIRVCFSQPRRFPFSSPVSEGLAYTAAMATKRARRGMARNFMVKNKAAENMLQGGSLTKRPVSVNLSDTISANLYTL